ncbi:unnamed protein product, partial [Tetraodon nigroviridis]
VYKVFENVAQKYDVMNDAMSLGIHRLWKDTLLRVMDPQPGAQLLDMAGGTGKTLFTDGCDIAFRFLKYTRSQQEKRRRRAARSTQAPSWPDAAPEEVHGPGESRAVVCDVNKEMLNVGKQKADSMGTHTGLSWVVGDAEELPFDDDQFDIYTIAFGIRNVTHIEQALQEALRVLKPGGRFICLEFSKVTNPLLARAQGLPAVWMSRRFMMCTVSRLSRFWERSLLETGSLTSTWWKASASSQTR